MDEIQNISIEDKIISTAKQLFSEKGYDRTSMSEIAAEVGINRPTLHYYFRTKEKMFESIFDSLVKKMAPQIESVVMNETSFSVKIEQLIDVYINTFTEDPYLPRFIFGEIQRDTDHLINVMKRLGFESYLVNLKAIIEQGNREGVVKNVPVPVVLLTFIAEVTIPFITRNLTMKILFKDKEEFDKFLPMWKKHVVEQMEALLIR